MDSLIPVLIIIVLILVNGIFVAAEFAIIGTPLVSVERRAKLGHRIAKQVVSILRNPRRQDEYIATAQLGITFASLGLGMYGEHVLAGWFHALFFSFGASSWFPAHIAGTVTSVALLTYLHIVFGEMIPKALALQQAERTTLWITPFMLWVKRSLYPLVVGLNRLGDGILRLFGVNRQFATNLGYTPEELEYLIAESQQGGALRAETGKLLRELLRFSDLTAGEIMVPRVRVIGIPLGESSEELKDLLRGSTHTLYPVYREDLDGIVGFVHVKDLLPKLLHGESLVEADTRPLPFVPYTAKVDDVLAAMYREPVSMAVVMDEFGGTAGIVTVKDLLEEVIGEMHEDLSAWDFHKDAEGRLHVRGSVRLSVVGEQLGIGLEHGEVETVGGLVLSLLGRPAKPGDIVSSGDLRIEVSTVEGNGVESCLIDRLETGEDTSK